VAAVPKRDYVAMGEQGIQELLAQEHAVVGPEIEARLADDQWPTLTHPVQPHHLTTARHKLIQRGVIQRVVETTRGGRQVPVYIPVEQRLRKRAISDAAARKRLLHTRFMTWSSGSAAVGSGVIGPAGEAVVHAALTAAAPYGYRLFNPVDGQTSMVLGTTLSGPIDNGGILSAFDHRTHSPAGQYVVVVEVKNVRSWIYIGAAELHQLLDKAAGLQRAHPQHKFLPVLVCRRAHPFVNHLAEQLGFYVISTKRQYVPAALPARELEEVRTELGYDLEALPGTPPPALVRHFSQTLPSVAERTAERWATSAVELGNYFTDLHDTGLRGEERTDLTNELVETAKQMDLAAIAAMQATHVDDFDDEPPF
jgi:hypothetical protein